MNATFPTTFLGLGNLNVSYPNTSQETNSTSNNLHMKITKWTLYAAIFCISSIGNALVCVIILKKKRMKTVTNYFILNLAIADLTLTLICIPFDIPVQEMNYRWPYGSFMCKILYPLQTMCLCASVFTLTAVSITRCWAITHPFRNQLTTKQAKWIISGIWVLAVVPVSPYMYVLHIKDGECQETSWLSDQHRKGYTLSLFVMEYVIPLLVIVVSYIKIGYELNKHSNPEHKHIKNLQSEETSKVVRMLIVVTTVFAVCVLPTNVMWLWLDFGTGANEFEHFWEVVAFCNILTFANSAANPICYTILNENYRKEFKYYFTYCCRRSALPNNDFTSEFVEMTEKGDLTRRRSTFVSLLRRS